MTSTNLYAIILILTLFCCYQVDAFNSTDLLEQTKNGLTNYIFSDTLPEILTKPETTFQFPFFFRNNRNALTDQISYNFISNATCIICQIIIDGLILQRRLGFSRDYLTNKVKTICIVLGIETPEVCDGFIEMNADLFIYMIDNKPDLNHERVCSLFLTNCPKSDNYNWTINIPEAGSNYEKIKPDDSETYKILQISDIHYDPLYQPGKNAKCNEPLCCQADHPDPTDVEAECGYWLDYNAADTPWHTIVDVVRQVNTQQYDWIYYTGDVIGHRVWTTSIENNTRDLEKFYNYFTNEFNVSIYPILGNHEPHPMNVWWSSNSSDPFSTAWLFELIAEQWTAQWLPNETRETILNGGFYTVSPMPGFRIISINSNVAYYYNFWLIYDDYDPYGQLQWLSDTLYLAEQNNETVHILSHVPSGGDMLAVWAREYRRIINRFSHIITGHFNGHTHIDQFVIYYNDNEEPTNVAFNGASVTSYTDTNPSYKIYTVDTKTISVLDYEEWTFNLTSANLEWLEGVETIDWYKLYSFKEAYGVESLQPNDIDELLYRMTNNHTLLELYNIYKYRNSDPGLKSSCLDDCHKSNLCEIVTTVADNQSLCRKFSDLYDNNSV